MSVNECYLVLIGEQARETSRRKRREHAAAMGALQALGWGGGHLFTAGGVKRRGLAAGARLCGGRGRAALEHR